MKPKSQYLKKGQKQNSREKKRLARLQAEQNKNSGYACGTISPDIGIIECCPPGAKPYRDHPRDHRVLISLNSGLIAVHN